MLPRCSLVGTRAFILRRGRRKKKASDKKKQKWKQKKTARRIRFNSKPATRRKGFEGQIPSRIYKPLIVTKYWCDPNELCLFQCAASHLHKRALYFTKKSSVFVLCFQLLRGNLNKSSFMNNFRAATVRNTKRYHHALPHAYAFQKVQN